MYFDNQYYAIFENEDNTKTLFTSNKYPNLLDLTINMNNFVDMWENHNGLGEIKIYCNNEQIGYFQEGFDGWYPCVLTEEGERNLLDND